MVPVKKKTKIAILAATCAVFALVLAIALLLSRGAGSDRVQSGEHPLRISEYMSSNTAYPDADGRVCDWIEIHNPSDKPFNVSGYRLSDDVTQAKYAFPTGTVIPAARLAKRNVEAVGGKLLGTVVSRLDPRKLYDNDEYGYLFRKRAKTAR